MTGRSTRRAADVKVEAIINLINGKHSDGSRWARDRRGESEENDQAAPAIFGMNFQAVSVGQKLPVGGYADAEGTPSANLAAARAPDVFIQPDAGVIYSGSKKRIAEHGGGTPDDTHVALLISVAGVEERHVAAPVETTQVAPTILRALGLDPRELQAVREEHTKLLTGAPF